MRLKEREALFWVQEDQPSNLQVGDSISLSPNYRAYLAGFEKAKEMALQEEHGYEGPFISGSSIEELGEEEVDG